MTVLGLQRVEQKNADCFSVQNYNVRRLISTLFVGVAFLCQHWTGPLDVETTLKRSGSLTIAETRQFGTS